MNTRYPLANISPLQNLSWIWLGLIIGVSFIATPAKFLAPSLSLPVALEVGRATFGTFKYIECVTLVVAVILAIKYKTDFPAVAMLAAIIAVLLIQYGWLLPILDARVEMIVQGEIPPTSSTHLFYVVLEIMKIVCLIMLAVFTNRSAPGITAGLEAP